MTHKLAELFLSALILFAVSGCQLWSTAPAPAPAPAPVEPVPPLWHVWSYLRSYGEEPHGFGTYSYVIAGRGPSDASHARRYDALVAAIQGSTPGSSDVPQSATTNVMNLFLIPAGRYTDSWNIELSMSLAAALTASDARFRNPGPFIVTLDHPISFSANPEVAMLFVDLTNTHPSAMPEIAAAYKRHISEVPLQGVARLKSLKLAVLTALLVTEDSIAFATAAYADLASAFVR